MGVVKKNIKTLLVVLTLLVEHILSVQQAQI